LAAKGEAIPALGYDLHDPNFPFGRSAVVSVPDVTDGSTGASHDMVLPAVVAPVIDTLVTALAERDDRIKELEQRLESTPAPAPAPPPAAPIITEPPPATPPPAAPIIATPRRPAAPKSLGKRLSSFVRQAVRGREVHAVLSSLEEEIAYLHGSRQGHHRWALAGLIRIYDETATLIVKSRELIEEKINRDRFSPRDVLLFVLNSIAAEKLRSGSFHEDHGVLALTGRHLFALWQYSSRELLTSGQTTAEETHEARQLIEKDISTAG
jgi:hypothetical protein